MARVSVVIDDAIWFAFRKACLDHHVTATSVIIALVKKQLDAWETEERTEPLQS